MRTTASPIELGDVAPRCRSLLKAKPVVLYPVRIVIISALPDGFPTFSRSNRPRQLTRLHPRPNIAATGLEPCP